MKLVVLIASLTRATTEAETLVSGGDNRRGAKGMVDDDAEGEDGAVTEPFFLPFLDFFLPFFEDDDSRGMAEKDGSRGMVGGRTGDGGEGGEGAAADSGSLGFKGLTSGNSTGFPSSVTITTFLVLG